MKSHKCPNCGAPVSGGKCAYCGQIFLQKEEMSVPLVLKSSDSDVEMIRPGRNLMDKMMIVLGAIWVGLVIAVAVELQYWHSLTEMFAAALLASPGIVLLQIGFRRKKAVPVRKK